ncbi:hypothetical protein [Pseudomonas fluorescens]|uniref:hypothetical protein n=1 Tax=Pseudomonas fluorescens TaxID=294 RepID=UPI001BE9015F|nr:hypothetical protein [Pseudomonas fluorescens]MBT2373298.1 hypothetical protein [Pseudomonas fluorescens]
MNATGGTSPAKAQNRYLARQQFLLRDNHPLASETRTTAPSPWRMPAGQSCGCSCNALVHPHRDPASRIDRRSYHPKKYLNRTTLFLSKPSLASFSMVKEPFQSGNNLCDLGHTLAVSLNEHPFWEVDSKYKKIIIYNMYRLKDHGIEIARDEYSIQRKALTGFNSLNLTNHIKVSISPQDQCLKLNGNPEFLNKHHDRMVTLTHNNKIFYCRSSRAYREPFIGLGAAL